MVESGIYQRWFENANIARSQIAAYVSFKEIDKTSNSSVKTGSYVEEPEATTLKQVRVPFVLYLGMLLTCLVTFIKEFKFTIKTLFTRVTRVCTI